MEREALRHVAEGLMLALAACRSMGSVRGRLLAAQRHLHATERNIDDAEDRLRRRS